MINKTVFRDPTRKTRVTWKISTFFEDLSFLNPRTHLKRNKIPLEKNKNR